MGATQAPEGRPGLRSRANAPAPQAPHTPDPQRLPSLAVDFCRKGSAPGIGVMRPPACQALARFPFDQHLFWWAGASHTLSSRSGQSHALQISPRVTGLCCVHRVSGGRQPCTPVCSMHPILLTVQLSGLVLTFFSPLESQRPSITCQQPPTTPGNCLPVHRQLCPAHDG